MHVLDELTLRRRRDILHNPLTAPLAHRIMFEYISPPAIPPPFVFGAMPQPPAMQPTPMQTDAKRGREDPTYSDQNIVQDETRQRTQEPPPPQGQKRKDRPTPLHDDENLTPEDKR